METIEASLDYTDANAVFPFYEHYMHDFHAAGGPFHPLMDKQFFADYWATLTADRRRYLAEKFHTGYEQRDAPTHARDIDITRGSVQRAQNDILSAPAGD